MLPQDLDKYVRDKIDQLGSKKATEFFINPRTDKQITIPTIHNWYKGETAIPTWAAQKVFNEFEQYVHHEDIMAEWANKKLIIGMPCYKDSTPFYWFGMLCLLEKHHGKIGFDIVTRTMIVQARNLLATKFMKTKADWLLMIDDDQVFPCGSPGVYTHKFNSKIGEPFASMDIVSRLLSHKTPLVGALYFGKHDDGRGQYAEALGSDQENRYAHGGPYDELRATKWVATGGMLIHRSVFEAIERKFPDVIASGGGGTTGNGYFTPLAANTGEDMSFCTRAAECGIQSFVDMGCMMGHIGFRSYWGHNTSS